MTTRLKGKIITIGGFDAHGLPYGWYFDIENGAIPFEMGFDGVGYWAGYSINDLAWLWHAWASRN